MNIIFVIKNCNSNILEACFFLKTNLILKEFPRIVYFEYLKNDG